MGKFIDFCHLGLSRPAAAVICGLLAVFVWFIQSCVSGDTRPSSSPPASTHIKDGTTYGTVKGAFRHRWWNYYERALSFSEGRFFAEAEADLTEAIRQRDGDQRMARTYGMHFVDYFPRRELGIVYLGQERIEAAITELETSLGQERSAKAEFYLDAARKKRIEKSGADRTNPVIAIASPEKDALMKGFSVRVEGRVTDDTFVKEVAVNGIPVRIDLSAPEIAFAVDVPLAYGTNTILVTATDLVGRVSVARVGIRTDRSGPTLGLETADYDPDAPMSAVRLKGNITDESGIQQIAINGKTLERPMSGAFRLDQAVPVKPGDDRLVIQAIDQAGNMTRAEIKFAGRLRSGAPVLLASAGTTEMPLLLAAATTAAPFIELSNIADGARLFADQLYIEITVESEIGVRRITVNGRPMVGSSGKRVFVHHLVSLKKGDNALTIAAEDEKGGVSEQRLRVHRNAYSIDENKGRLTVAVLPFEQQGAPSALAAGVYERVFGAVFESSRYDLVERQKLDAILQEQKIGSLPLADPATAIKVGKLAAAAGLVAGSILESGASMEIYARLIDVETSRVLAAVDVYGEPLDTEKMRTICTGLGLKLAAAIPREEGLVVKAKGRKFMIDMGADKGLKEGMRLILFEPPKDELDDTRVIATARITGVKEKTAVAEVIGDDGPKEVAVMTKVITQ